MIYIIVDYSNYAFIQKLLYYLNKNNLLEKNTNANQEQVYKNIITQKEEKNYYQLENFINNILLLIRMLLR